jgi:hypothetical protein
MMLRLPLALAGICLLTTSMGCSMCCAPFDTAFAAYGGAVERGDLHHGRVGSSFDPAEGQQMVSYEYQDDSMVVEPDTGFAPLESAEEIPVDE